MAKDDFYIVNSWMIEELELSGVELQCFAIIWSLSRGEKQMYIGGNSHLVKMTKRTEPTVISALKKLCEKGLIKKEPVIVNNVERNFYKAIAQGTKEILVGGLKNLSGGTKKILAPNIESNIESKYKDKKRECNKLPSTKKGGSSTRFVKPTIEQIEDYIKEKNLHFGAEQFFDYYESKGWMIGSNHMKDWKAACRTWEHKRNSQEKKEEPTEETQYPAGMDAEQWNEITFWMCNKVPKIAGKINPVTFDTMKKMAKDSQLLSMVLKEVDYRFTLDSSLDVMDVFKEELKNYWDEQTD